MIAVQGGGASDWGATQARGGFLIVKKHFAWRRAGV
jgi:hypothetical protein